MTRSIVALIVAALLGVACAPAIRRSDRSHRGEETGRDRIELFVRAARAMGLRGNHLEASYYLEAALQEGAPEARVLPLLIGAQMRSGRLRAAAKSIGRLKVIQSGRPHLDELEGIIARFDSAGFSGSEGGRAVPPDSAPGEVRP